MDAMKNEMANATAIGRRYSEGYTVASATVAVGRAIKVLGLLLCLGGMAAVLGGLAQADAAGAHRQADAMFGAVVAGVGLLSVPLGLLLMVLGYFAAAHGQTVRALLDIAVNTSPFLIDEERAAAMRIGRG